MQLDRGNTQNILVLVHCMCAAGPRQYPEYTSSSCVTRASHGLPHISYSLSTRFSLAFVYPCCPSCGTFVQGRHEFFVFSMLEEFTPFSFHFSHPVQEQYLHDLTQARSPFVDLSSQPHQTIQPVLIKPLVLSFL